MAILAVITNCGIIAFSPTMKNWLSMDLQPVTYITMFVTLEVSKRESHEYSLFFYIIPLPHPKSVIR